MDGRLSYLRDSAGTFGWLAARAAAQAVTVLLLARQLGPEAYGQLVAALAIGGFLAPFANLGLPGALLRDLPRQDGEKARRLESEVVGLWLRSGIVAGAAAGLMGAAVIPGELAVWMVAVLACGETVAVSGSELFARIFQARRRLGRFGNVMFSVPASRAIALASCALAGVGSAETWLIAYAGAGLVPMAWMLVVVPPRLRAAHHDSWALAREGWPFALAALAARLQGEFNKPLLAQYSLAGAGHLGLAQRLVDVASLPLMALIESFLPRLFALRERWKSFLLRAGLGLSAAALAIGSGMAVAGPYVLPYFGPAFSEATWALTALSLFPVLHALTILGDSALAAAGLAHRLPKVALSGGVVGCATAAGLIPWFGVAGAVSALYIGKAASLVHQASILRNTMKAVR